MVEVKPSCYRNPRRFYFKFSFYDVIGSKVKFLKLRQHILDISSNGCTRAWIAIAQESRIRAATVSDTIEVRLP